MDSAADRAASGMRLSLEEMPGLALSLGAAGAVVIPYGQVVLSAEFRELCRSNACGCYGRCHMCPPDVGDIRVLMARLSHCTHALVYQTISPLEDSFDIEGMSEASRAHVGLSLRLKRAMPGALHLSCGGCRLCEVCAKEDGQPCRRPEDAMSSLEAYGVDVYATVRDTPLRYTNGANTVTFFGMAFFEV